MNFQELMSRATQNNINAIKQKKRSGHSHKDSSPSVSSSAVQVFLAQKQHEKKSKQVEQDAAKLARIQARLEQNLKPNQETIKGKRKPELESSSSKLRTREKPVDDFPSKPAKIPKKEGQRLSEKQQQISSEKQRQISSEKQRQQKQRKTKDQPNDTKIRNSASTVSKDKGQQNSVKERKGVKTREVKSKLKHTSASTSKITKKKKSLPPPPNFKELLAIAEQNKSGLNKRKVKTEPLKKAVEDNCIANGESKTKRKNPEISESKKKKVVTVDKKEGQNGGHVNHKWMEKQHEVRKEFELKRRKALANKSREPESMKNRTIATNQRDIISGRPKIPGPYTRDPYGPPRKMFQQSYPARPSYCDENDEDEDDDLEGFIDDGEDELARDGDVSMHIRQIFGYDRRKFAGMDDFDDSAMESNYSQIEKEEKRSSKIAKLEDEIDILKEQAELKRQRDKLLKKTSKSRKT